MTVPVPQASAQPRAAELTRAGTQEATVRRWPRFVPPALGHSQYRVLWLGLLPATMAHQMAMVVLGYAAFTLTGSATALGLVSVATGVPMLAFSLVGGVVADRAPRRVVLIATQAGLTLTTGLMAGLAGSGRLELWHVLAFAFAQGIAFSFNMPARQAYIVELVGRELLPSALALNSAGLNLSRVAGPAIGGAVLAVPSLHIGGAFGVMATMFLLAFVSLLRLPAASPLERGPGAPRSGWSQLVEGLAYLRSSPALLGLIGLGFLPVLLGMPYQSLMPLFAERVFAVGPAGLGALLAAAGIGALSGSLAIATIGTIRRMRGLQLAAGVTFGLALAAFALAPSFPVATGLLALAGAGSAAYMAVNQTLVMAATDRAYHGRIMSVYLMTFGAMPAGTLPAAWLADHIGGRVTVAGMGALVAGSILLLTLLIHRRLASAQV